MRLNGPSVDRVASAIVADHIRLVTVSLNHDSHLLADSAGDGWIVKHNAGKVTTAAEHAVVTLLNDLGTAEVRRTLPTLAPGVASDGTLALDLVQSSATLRMVIARYCAPPEQTLASVGTALSQIHGIAMPSPICTSLTTVPTHPIIHGRLSPKTLEEMSTASRRLAVLIDEIEPLKFQLSLLAGGSWRCLIHNDLKWDNILVHPREGETEPTEVKLIDWEMAGLGDPCWDVGTVLSEFVAFWALSIPVVGGEPYEGLAKYPIEDMQPAIRAFWESYAEAMEFDRATARERLLKSVRFAGARLIQTAYERTQTMTHLTPHIYLLLQLSLNIMEGPEEAAEGLFGIPLPDGVGV